MLFVSKISNLRLIRKPADRMMDEYRRPIVLRGERVEFEHFRFRTEDPDLIEWLLNHELYGVEFTSDKKDDKPVQKPQIDKILLADTDDQNPIKPAKPPIPQMVAGVLATAKTVEVPDQSVPISNPAPKTPTKDEISSMIREEINLALRDVIGMLKESKPKRTFACKECGLEFGSGVQLGAHKLAHVKEKE